MPLRPDLRALDEAYRRRLLAVMAAVGLISRRRWGRLTPDDIRRGSRGLDEWMDATSTAALNANRILALESAKFNREVRAALRMKQIPLTLPPPPPLVQIRTSLHVTGVVGASQRLAKISWPLDIPSTVREGSGEVLRAGVEAAEREAMEKSGEAAGAAAARHAANGGRDQTILEVVESKALGYVRVTGPDPCYFCAMLATRGILPGSGTFSADSFAQPDARFEGEGTAKVHDNCSCHLRPVYAAGGDGEVPENNQRLAALWEAGGSGDLNEWRRFYEANRASVYDSG